MKYTEWEVYKQLRQENLLAYYYPWHRRSKLLPLINQAMPCECLPMTFAGGREYGSL